MQQPADAHDANKQPSLTRDTAYALMQRTSVNMCSVRRAFHQRLRAIRFPSYTTVHGDRASNSKKKKDRARARAYSRTKYHASYSVLVYVLHDRNAAFTVDRLTYPYPVACLLSLPQQDLVCPAWIAARPHSGRRIP
jgi:hypothetical protein